LRASKSVTATLWLQKPNMAPRQEHAVKLADALEIPPDELIKEAD
jgi:hypothetical protein